jgi:hypothetical protein
MKSTKTIESYRNTSREKNRSSDVSEGSKFADPTRIKSENKKEMPRDGKGSPWDYSCPQYDQRSSNFVNAGTHYGVGHRQPVGHEGNPKSIVDVLPQQRKNTMQDDDLG